MTEDSIRWAIRCHGHRGDGAPCSRWAIRGGFVCPSHGGRAGQVRRAARLRLTEIAARRMFDSWMRSPVYREARERAELAGDRAALEAFAARLA